MIFAVSAMGQNRTTGVQIGGNVFGGGNKAVVSGNCSVTISQSGSEVTGDVYGGGAFANVNATMLVNGTDTTYSYNDGKTTKVDLTDGTIGGDVYGGGLGRADNPTTTNVDEAIKAMVYGIVTVNIGAASGDYNGTTINGSVYGCNNINGSPLKDVNVHVYKTAHNDTNKYPKDTQGHPTITTLGQLDASFPSNPDDPTNQNTINYHKEFALKAVYGGGNKASYIPEASGKTIIVHVHECMENTVLTVYGGGNAADVGILDSDPNTQGNQKISANTKVIIEGGRFDRVFGGGNGYSETHNHNNPYLNANNECDNITTDTPCPDYNPGANIYGKATTEIKGGLFRQIFGGNNQYGDVDEVDLTFNKECSPLLIHESFGGANEADIHGDVVTNLKCSDIQIGNFYGGSNLADIIEGNVTLNVYGGTYTNVFGGSKGYWAENEADRKSADIRDVENGTGEKGNVTLNLFGGHMTNAFGGCDVYGNIEGKITVNVLDFETTSCALEVENIYGAGNLTHYTPKNSAISSPEVNVIHIKTANGNSISGNVFGGAKGGVVDNVTYTAPVDANPKVNIGYDETTMGTVNDDTKLLYSLLHNPDPNITYAPPTSLTPANYTAKVGGSVYGGGEQAIVTGSTSVTIQKANTEVGHDVYGGGALADVGTEATSGENPTPATTHTVSMENGSVRMLFGGGMGQDASKASAIPALVNGNTVVNVSGGTVIGNTIFGSGTTAVNGGVFGGCNVNGTVKGNTTVVITTAVGTENKYLNVYGGGLGEHTNVQGSAAVTVDAENKTLFGDVYGGSAMGLVNYKYNSTTEPSTGDNITTSVELDNGTVHGNIYGGGHGLNDKEAHVGRDISVTVNEGTVTERLFGGNNIKGFPQGNVLVEVNGGEIQKSVFGGGNQVGGSYSATVNINGGIVGSDGSTVTNIGDLYGVYGGCYNNGTVTGAINVNINAGTLGREAGENITPYVLKGIFGGGYGAGTGTTHNVTVTIGDKAGTYKPTIYGDIYGGSALGSVNTDGNNTTKVDFLNGSLMSGTFNDEPYGGNVYGGGLGQKDDPNTDENEAIEAKVYGKVEVNIGASDQTDDQCNIVIAGNVFGCNNLNGSPQDDVAVNIYKTAHTTDNTYPDPAPTTVENLQALPVGDANFAIQAVYGGGNLANYVPVKVTEGDPHNATVHVYNCNNTINEVYGGGNAANVGSTGNDAVTANTNVIIDGGRIHQVFGGGKGVKGGAQANTFGKATTTVNAGLIDEIYGAGNQHGSVNEISLNLDKATGSGACTDEVFGKVFGGANEADSEGDLATTVNCGVNLIGELYGGSNKANITGNVELNVEGGTITQVFGGSKGDLETLGNTGHSNIPASILAGSNNKGNVTLNLFGGTITDAFGGSNYNGNIQGKITVNMLNNQTGNCSLTVHNIYGSGNLTAYTPNDNTLVSPEVNLFHGTVSTDGNAGGNVFGGAKGGRIGETTYAATVTANPKVTIGYNTGMDLPTGINSITQSQVSVAGNVFGGGDEAPVTGNTSIVMQRKDPTSTDYTSAVGGDIFGGGNNISDDAGVTSSSVTMSGGTLTGDLYGGCNVDGTVGSTSTVILTGGSVGGSVFGGGFGENTSVTSKATVHVSGDGTQVNGDVYGGGNLGVVNGGTEVKIQATEQ